MALLDDVLRLFNTYESFIIGHDIPVAIEGKSNYLAALGLSTYTEVFGGLYRGTLKMGQGKANYDAFIKDFFGDSYVDVDCRLRKDGLKGLYSAVRSGLVHEYLMKDISMVVMESETPLN